MFARFSTVVAVLSVAAGALAQVTINTPLSVVVCQPVALSWSGGTPPYFLSILPGNQPGASALVDFGQQTGTSLSWTANLAAGTSIFLQVRDSTGQIGQSGTISIQTGSDTSCVGQPTSSATGSSSSSGSAVSSTRSVPTSSSAAPSSTPSSTPTSRPTSSSTGTSATSSRATTSSPAATTSSASSANKFASSGALALAGVAAVAALL